MLQLVSHWHYSCALSATPTVRPIGVLQLVSHWHCPCALRSAPLVLFGSSRLALCPAVSAPELIKSFAESAPPDVQQAVRSTVVSLLGNLPPHMYDTSIASTGQVRVRVRVSLLW